MAGVLESVNQRTQLAGQNRLELLLFRVNRKQRYGINVFKVREVIVCPSIQQIPHSHPKVRGVIQVRNKTFPVIDLGLVLGSPLPADTTGLYVVITEFSRSVQGFLVSGVDRILNMNWDTIMPPPNVASHYLTGVTQFEKELIEIIDVEKVLAEVHNVRTEVSEEVAEAGFVEQQHLPLLVVDDSGTARSMIQRTLEQLGLTCITANSGKEALAVLKKLVEDGTPVYQRISMVLSDIEMPEMDGYTLTAEIRKDERLRDLHIVLHSSMSGGFNEALTKKVGADHFLAKFNPDELATVVMDQMPGSRAALPRPV
jgi:two-component system chemotaxis response regulator CheV